MELTDILSLVKAGYTREEISAMEQTPEPNPVPVVTPVATPTPVTEHIPAPVDVPDAPPVAVPTPQPAQQEAQPTMAELMQSIAKLTSAVQANAIAQSVIPGGLQTTQPTAEDMLAEIIRPTYKAREESI